MRNVLGWATVTIGLLSASAAAQSQPQPAPPAEQGTGTATAEPEKTQDAQEPRKNPYARLFTYNPPEPEVQSAPVQEMATRPPNSRRVVCGMTVLQADPSVDPRMVIPRVDDGTRPAIRTITPPVCWD